MPTCKHLEVNEHESNRAQDGLSRPVIINLDEIEHEPTGDPLLDRGMQMTIDELEEALAAPKHPDYEAAKAANRELSKQFSGFA